MKNGEKGVEVKMIQSKKYYKETASLAFPIILSLAGQSIVQMIDIIMVGRLGALELASVSLSSSVITNILVIGLGIAISLTPLAGKAFAMGRYVRAASFFQNSISLNVFVSLILVALLFVLFPFLSRIGQPPEVVRMAYPYYTWVSLSLIPYMLFLSFKQFMEGLGNTKVAMFITIGCNVVNVALNYILIYGKFGVEAMGVEGAAIATFSARVLMPVVFFVYMFQTHPYKRFFQLFRWKHFIMRKQIQLLKVGGPISAQMGMECFSLSLITIMMGWIGTTALAAYQVVMTVASFAYMVSNGFAGGVTVLVSHALGRKQISEVRKYANSGMHLAVLFMTCSTLVVLFLGRYVAQIFSTDTAVIDLAVILFYVVGFFQIVDGIQVCALGTLRGLMDVKKPMLFAGISYIIISLPVAYVLGFVFDWGPVGVFSGFSVGLFVACFLFSFRIKYLLKRVLSA